jgi:hypothetical protein
MKKAVINIESKEVENIIEYADRGVAMRLPLGYTVYDCTQFDVQIGDTFEDGVFYRDGEPVEYKPSDAERLALLEAELAALAGTEVE